jgi:hypothetical protein
VAESGNTTTIDTPEGWLQAAADSPDRVPGAAATRAEHREARLAVYRKPFVPIAVREHSRVGPFD